MQNKIHKIPEEKLSSFVNRQAKRNIKPAIITFITFPLLILLFFPSFGILKLLVLPILGFAALISGIIYVGSLNQIENWAKITEFYYDDEKILKHLEKGDLNLVNQFAINRNEHRYGSKFNQKIVLKRLSSTKITSKDIIFTENDYNFFTGNGRIYFPSELDCFEKLKSHILEDKSRYRYIEKKLKK